jgi:hypothetical protein
MSCRGILRGKTIELEELLPYPEGQTVTVSIEAVEDLPLGSPALLLKAMREPPHLEPGDIEELERVLADSKLPVKPGGIFDDEGGAE